MTDFPAPLTPPDCNLQDFARMWIDIPRLFGSAFDSLTDDAAWRCGVTLWLKAFHQTPAASLPDNDVELAKLAGLGRDVAGWRRVREAGALHGWVKCADGLLYHPVVAEVALEAWIAKLTQSLSSGAGNAKRYGGVFDAAPVRAQIESVVEMLRGLNADNKVAKKHRLPTGGQTAPDGSPPGSRQEPAGIASGSHQDAASIPSGSRRGPRRDPKREGKGDISPQPPLAGGSPAETDEDFERVFAAIWRDFPMAGKAASSEAEARHAVAQVVAAGLTAEVLARAVARYAEWVAQDRERGARVPAMHRWFLKGRYQAHLPKAVAAKPADWHGPPDLWDEVAAATSADFAATWLGVCAWRDVPEKAVVARTGIVQQRLKDRAGSVFKRHGVAVVLEVAA